MLERIEVLGGGRKELRRDVRLVCSLESDYWDESIPHRLVDLSPSGGFIETQLPLAPDEELEVRFHPPRSRALYWLRARVVRSSFGRRCAKRDIAGMGVEFLDLSPGDRAALASQLVGIPPRIPLERRTVGGRKTPTAFGVAYEEFVFVEELPPVDHARELDAIVFRALAPILY